MQETETRPRHLDALGLNQGTSGNASVRMSENPADGFVLTPTSLAVEAEQLAKLYLTTLATGIRPVILDAAEIARVANRFRMFGYRSVE